MNSISLAPSFPVLAFALSEAASIAYVTGHPVPLTIESLTACMSTAFTPSGTTVTMSFYYDDTVPALVFSGATPRISFAAGVAFAAIRHYRVWGRRKPGSTGSIAAQTVKLQSWDGSAYVEVARIGISAAAAGAEPVSDYLDVPKHAGDSRFYFDAAHPFKFIFDSADSDLEIVFEAEGLVS